MSNNNQETPWWQTALQIVAVGTGAVVVNKLTDNAVEELETLSDDEATAQIANWAATLDENLWTLTMKKMEYRYSLRKFSQFAHSAWQLRQVTDKLLENDETDLEQGLVRVLMRLDEGSYNLFRKIVDCKSAQNSEAAYLGHLIDRVGGAAAEVKQLLSMDVSIAQEVLADALYGMRPADRRLFIAILMYHSEQSPSLLSRALVGRAHRLHLQIGS
jgi:hypothetical protein